jgi:hypothetical protein
MSVLGVPLDRLKELVSEVHSEQLWQVMPPPGVITMVFTDIVDSTRVKRELAIRFILRR